MVSECQARSISRLIYTTLFFCFCSSSFANKLDNKPASSETESHLKSTIHLAGANEYGGPQDDPRTVFECTEKIIAVVDLENYKLGKHHLSVKWVDPYSEVKEHTQYSFHVHAQKTRVWAWLSFTRGTGAGMLQWINPAAGLEDFIGLWKIEVKIDGKLLGSDSFEVSC